MTTLYVDFNDMTRPGCIRLRAQMQPDGELPALAAGRHVLLREYGDDESLEAVIAQDASGGWLADIDAAHAQARSKRGLATAG